MGFMLSKRSNNFLDQNNVTWLQYEKGGCKCFSMTTADIHDTSNKDFIRLPLPNNYFFVLGVLNESKVLKLKKFWILSELSHNYV